MTIEEPCSLESVIRTELLSEREASGVSAELETKTTLAVVRDLAEFPESFFAAVVRAVLRLSKAHSSGISLLNEEKGRFVWPAVAGPLNVYLGEGTPADFGPCGTVLEKDASVLFQHPERHFTYLASVQPALNEVLLVPFHVNGKAVGTIWAVIHDDSRVFDAEDRRILETLSKFAASAYQVLEDSGALTPFLWMKLAAQTEAAAGR